LPPGPNIHLKGMFKIAKMGGWDMVGHGGTWWDMLGHGWTGWDMVGRESSDKFDSLRARLVQKMIQDE
jgi:hypothetical protein